jgi:ribosomal protein S18 acetylase RimI-like enzyme
MHLRLATLNDLIDIKAMYEEVIIHMQGQGLNFWDEYYPCPLFLNDIKNKNLYLLVDKNEIIAAFVLSSKHEGVDKVEWENINSKAFYLDRFAVSVKRLREGIGALAVDHAKRLAKVKGANYLRLFVVDNNTPAIKFYKKINFKRVNGIYEDTYEEGLFLRQFGYEIKV